MNNHRSVVPGAGLVLVLWLSVGSAQLQAASATWNLHPANGDWNDSFNWSPATVPNGPADIASFGLSKMANVFLSAATEINTIAFNPGASAYTITASESFTLTISGAGIINNSGITQNFVAPIGGLSGTGTFPRIRFNNSATAGNSTVFTTNGGAASGINGGDIGFYNNSTAGNATFINNGSSHPGASGGSVRFNDNSSAGNATLIAYGGVNGGQAGRIFFSPGSSGGTARVQLFGNGQMDLLSSLTIGSLEGDGFVVGPEVGSLSVGSNNLSTTFSGPILGGGIFIGGLTKIGTGTLTLGGANTYTGDTIVNGGQLVVNGSVISKTTVNGGTLGGSGIVRAIVVNSGGTLSPGNGVGILNAVGNLTLSLGATYLIDLNGTAVGKQYDQTNVSGAVALGNATLSLRLGFTPAAGDQFTIINNDGGEAVSGIFLGLPQGSLVAAAGGIFTISYGNDVVLTSVVPEPATWIFLSAGFVLFARSWQRKRHISEVVTS